jgi:Sporulation and spore germination
MIDLDSVRPKGWTLLSDRILENPMDERTRYMLYGVLFGLAVAIAAGVGWGVARRTTGMPADALRESVTVRTSAAKRAVHLYFGDALGRQLIAEQRVLGPADDDVALARRLIEVLIEGPRQAGTRTLPQGARLRAVYILGNGDGNDGTAVVDFTADSFAGHPGGVGAELLSIYSIVNTLAFNIDSIRSVKVLIGGRQAATLAGHVDLSRPFRADMMWVR